MPAEHADGSPMVLLAAPATAQAPADRFTGAVWVDGITDGAGPGCARLALVRFSPGARTAWHTHAHGQTLHVTDGHGIVGSRDGHTIVLAPGDIVYTPPGVWHWHGAAPDSFMCQLALADRGVDAGVEVEWGAHVTDTEYADATNGRQSGTSLS